MEGIIASIITGVLALAGVIVSNVRSNASIENKLVTAQAVTDTKLDNLTEEVKKLDSFASRMPVLENEIKTINRRIDGLEARVKGDDGK